VNQYVIDFYCPELKLAIEIDGDSHYGYLSEKCDNERQKYIESFGIHFMRFTNDDVCNNIDGVLQMIYERTTRYNENSTPPHVPSSLRRGDRGGEKYFLKNKQQFLTIKYFYENYNCTTHP
jgi:hypothetical protein